MAQLPQSEARNAAVASASENYDNLLATNAAWVRVDSLRAYLGQLAEIPTVTAGAMAAKREMAEQIAYAFADVIASVPA